MRVYLSATLPLLARAHAAGRYGEPGAFAHAVTPALREWYTEGDLEELEYAALLDAAQGSLRLLSADPGAPRRRVVVAAEVADALVTPAPGEPARSTVALRETVLAGQVVSVHVDDDDAAGDVAAAARALPAAARGDEDARFAVDGAEAHELLWYDATEIASLLDTVRLDG
jgi:LPS sulfotransferase NodH